MRYILILTICIISFKSVSQNKSTFFATKLSDNAKLKLVLVEGDKLKVKYQQSGNSTTLKGRLNKIGLNYIIIDKERIELKQLNQVSAHQPGIKVIGGILFASGSALIATGINRKQNPITITKASSGGMFTFKPEKTIIRDGTGLIFFGALLCGISTVGILTPVYCTKFKYRFGTNISE